MQRSLQAFLICAWRTRNVFSADERVYVLSMDLREMERREAAIMKERDVLRERLRHAELRYLSS